MPSDVSATFRSAAVAQMANMPGATLSIREQRCRAVQPAKAASGHRRFSPDGVQRVLLWRRLTEKRHAVGAIAALDLARWHALSLGFAAQVAAASRTPARALASRRLVLVGPALAARLERLAHLPMRVAVFDSRPEAAHVTLYLGAGWLRWHAPALTSAVECELHAAQWACHARQVLVAHRFAGSATIKPPADQGVILIRQPADDETFGTLLASVEADFLTGKFSPRRGPRRSVLSWHLAALMMRG